MHFFAPKDLPRLPKNVVFVIDRSGSMGGIKIKQVTSGSVPLCASAAVMSEFDFCCVFRHERH